MMHYFHLQGNISKLWELKTQIFVFKVNIQYGHLCHKVDLQFR